MINFKLRKKRHKVKLTKKEFFQSFVFALIFIVVFQSIMSLPLKYISKEDYYSYEGAGSPNNIYRYIKVDSNEKQVNNNFYITYVSSSSVHNLSELISVKFYNLMEKDFKMKKVPNPKVVKTKTMTEDELEQYYIRSTQQSMKNAVYVAYQKADKPLKTTNEGVVVSFVKKTKDYKRNNIGLKQGDYILSVNEQMVTKPTELAKILKNLKDKDVVKIKVSRDGKEVVVNHSIINIEGINYLGITADYGIDLSIPKEVKFDQRNVQGSSAGLMFTLFMIDQLTPESDLSKGYKIAGTGTINYKGEVGQISGVNYKVEGAVKGDFDIFFVPKDLNKEDSNEKIAKETLKKFKSDLKIVPVANVDEALSYLEQLEVKEESIK